MFRIQKPLPFPQLDAKPEITGLVNLSDDMQQCLSLLTAYNGSVRRLLRCNELGVLLVTSPQTNPVLAKTSVGDNTYYAFPSQLCSECIIKADASNAGVVHIQIDSQATPPTTYPLAAGDWVIIHPINLDRVNFKFTKLSDIVIIWPSR